LIYLFAILAAHDLPALFLIFFFLMRVAQLSLAVPVFVAQFSVFQSFAAK